MNCLKTFLALCFLLLSSCAKEESKKIITWEDFPETHQLKGIKMPLPKQMPPQRIDNLRVLRDGIVLLEFENYTNRTPKYLGTLFDLRGDQVLQNIFPTGRRPNEFLEALFLHNDYDYSDGKLLSFMDSERSKIFTYHLDSLLKHGEVAAPLKVLDYKSEVLRQGIGRLNKNDYICYNPYYMSYGNYINKGVPPLFKTNQDLEERGSVNQNPDKPVKYMTIFVSSRSLYTHPKKENIVLADKYSGNISFYDKKTLLLKTALLESDLALSKFKTAEMVYIDGPRSSAAIVMVGVKNFVGFRKGHQKYFYDPVGCQTADFIYLLYGHGQSYERSQDDKEKKPASLFKIDWDGNLVACYHLDRDDIDNISISQDGKALYANAYDKDHGHDVLVKYELP